jgi:hypothetical protein
MKGVVEVDGRLVAVGRNGLEGSAWTSDDGGDWTLVSAQAFQPEGRDIELEAVAILDSRLVAVGRETNSADADRAAAWFSDDGGTRWTRATVVDARFLDQQMIDVVAVQDGLVAVGNDDSHAAVWQSPDGVEWIPVSSDSFDGASGMKGLAQLSTGEIVAVGVASGDGRIWVSEPDQ